MPVALFCGGKPEDGKTHTGFFVIPQGERWALTNNQGEVSSVSGPKTVRCLGEKLTQMNAYVANESEYLEARYVEGHSEILPGPTYARGIEPLYKVDACWPLISPGRE